MIIALSIALALVGLFFLSGICFGVGRKVGRFEGYCAGKDAKYTDDIILRGRLNYARRNRLGQFRSINGRRS
jgi:hypothetical protein